MKEQKLIIAINEKEKSLELAKLMGWKVLKYDEPIQRSSHKYDVAFIPMLNLFNGDFEGYGLVPYTDSVLGLA